MSGLFKAPKLPPIEPPTPMPDQTALDAARRRLVAKESTGGYGSTLLSAGGRETLGG